MTATTDQEKSFDGDWRDEKDSYYADQVHLALFSFLFSDLPPNPTIDPPPFDDPFPSPLHDRPSSTFTSPTTIMNLPPDFQLFQDGGAAPASTNPLPGAGVTTATTAASSSSNAFPTGLPSLGPDGLPLPPPPPHLQQQQQQQHSIPQPLRRETAEMTAKFGPTLTGSAERSDSEAWGMEGVVGSSAPGAPIPVPSSNPISNGGASVGATGGGNGFGAPPVAMTGLPPLSDNQQAELLQALAQRGAAPYPFAAPSTSTTSTIQSALPPSVPASFATGHPNPIGSEPIPAAEAAARKTVSPQEAFLDYDDVNKSATAVGPDGRRISKGGGAIGGSLFAPLPSAAEPGQVQRQVREGSSGAVAPVVGGVGGAKGGAGFDKPGNAVTWDNNEDADAEGEEDDAEGEEEEGESGFVKPYVPRGFKEKQERQAARRAAAAAAAAAAEAETDEANARRAITPAPPANESGAAGEDSTRHRSLPPELSRTREPTPPLPALPSPSDLDAEGDDEYLAPPPPPHARRAAAQRQRKRTSVYVDQLSSDSQKSSSDELEDDDPSVAYDDDADGDDDDDFYDTRPHGASGSGKKAGRTIGGVSNPNSSGGPSQPKRRRVNNPSGPAPAGTIRCTSLAADGTGAVCGTVFRRPYDLARHKETIHGEGGKTKKEHICEKCGGVFSRKDALIRHRRIRGHQPADEDGDDNSAPAPAAVAAPAPVAAPPAPAPVAADPPAA